MLVNNSINKIMEKLVLRVPLVLYSNTPLLLTELSQSTPPPQQFDKIYLVLSRLDLVQLSLVISNTEFVTCSSVILKSLIDVIAFINETQVFICDNSNFINNPLYISMYIQAVSREDLHLSIGIPIYIQACHMIVI